MVDSGDACCRNLQGITLSGTSTNCNNPVDKAVLHDGMLKRRIARTQCSTQPHLQDLARCKQLLVPHCPKALRIS